MEGNRRAGSSETRYAQLHGDDPPRTNLLSALRRLLRRERKTERRGSRTRY